MKKLFILDESERERILNMHTSATSRQYLSEQQTNQPFIIDDTIQDYVDVVVDDLDGWTGGKNLNSIINELSKLNNK